MDEYAVQCWNCALEFDALSVQWCGCSAVAPTKICPYCYSCMCKAPESYKTKFWNNAPAQLQEEKNSFNQPRDKLGDLLVRQNLLTNDQLLKALKTQKETDEKLGTVLVKLGFVTEDEVRGALSQQFGIMSIDLEKTEIQQELLDEIGVDLIKKYQFIPLEKQELPTKTMITIAVSAPIPPNDLDVLQTTIGCTIYPVLAQDQIFQSLFTKVISQESEDSKQARFIQQAKLRVNNLLAEALKRRSSDILIEPEDNELAIHFRIGGRLFKTSSPPVALCPFIMKRLKIMGKIEQPASNEELNVTISEGRFVVKTKNKQFDFLMRVFPIPTGERIAITIIDDTVYSQKLNKVFLDPGSHSLITSLLKLRKGIIFLIGPAGSGKAVTLYSLMASIDDSTRKIISIENPILLNLPDVIQHDASLKFGKSYFQHIESSLADYPDILIVTEINDRKTAELLFSHAQDMLIIVAVDFLHMSELMLYLTGLGLTRSELTKILAVVNQRMLPSLCTKCRIEMPLDEDDATYFHFESVTGARAFRGSGCENCSGTGYAGFLPLNEIFAFDAPVRQKIHDENSFLWLDLLSPPPQARNIKRLAADLLAKGWINIEDARSIDTRREIPVEDLKPYHDGTSKDGDTDKISINGSG